MLTVVELASDYAEVIVTTDLQSAVGEWVDRKDYDSPAWLVESGSVYMAADKLATALDCCGYVATAPKPADGWPPIRDCTGYVYEPGTPGHAAVLVESFFSYAGLDSGDSWTVGAPATRDGPWSLDANLSGRQTIVQWIDRNVTA